MSEEPIDIDITPAQFADLAEAQATEAIDVFREMDRSGMLASMGLDINAMERFYERDMKAVDDIRKAADGGD